MIIKKYPAPPVETAASRYDRDWLSIPDLDTAGHDDDRHDRTLLQQSVERKSRRYVDDGVSAVINEGSSEPPEGMTLLWSDNFEGPEFNERWSVFHGTPALSPLRRQEGSSGPAAISTIIETPSAISFDLGLTEGEYHTIISFNTVDYAPIFLINVHENSVVLANDSSGFHSIPLEEGASEGKLSIKWTNGEVEMEVNGKSTGPVPAPNVSPILLGATLDGENQIHSISVFTPESSTEPSEPEGTVWSDNFSEETLGELWSQLIGAPLKTNPLRSSNGGQAMIASKPTLANRIETEVFFGQGEAVEDFSITINSAQGAPLAAISASSSGSIDVQSSSGQDSIKIGDLTDKKARISVEFDQDAIRVFVDSALTLTLADDSIPDGPYMLALSIEGSIEVLYFRAILNNGGGAPEPEPEIPSEPEVPEDSFTEEFREVY